ncbi:MAG: hypothetical protein AVDCRST_MAG19-2216 [uncultured Thermomicrobiales bacterium]|uniref:Peptidase M1 membrane alanine aminopeptidase domain-containing protein n=1 Tax=uncultured Thermomicrobiales bacterium TaxID=1645740 RepID=A0A6J4V008_9BACT|nr:MAG: hypothetical protein AVDCRST_MAG19-2216 [uncultured Thermomicrobiales bacterium]
MIDPGGRSIARLPIRPFRWLAIVLLVGLALGGSVAGRKAAAAPDAYADVVQGLRGEVRTETAGELSSYDFDVTLDPAAGTIGGTARVGFENGAASKLDAVYFRLYPNAAYYGEGGLTVTRAAVGGAPVMPALEVEGTALRVPLPEPIAPGGTAEIDLAFATTVPVDSAGSYGIFGRDSTDGTWVLADWHPVLAVFEDGVGWRIDPPTPFGDPTFAASALYDVAVTAPAGLTIVASGVAAGEEAGGGLVTRRFVAGPAREFTLVADDDYAAVSAEVDGTRVTAYTEPEPTARAGAEAAVAVAVRALGVYGEAFGAYPFAELDLVQTRLSGALAVSWSGIVFLDGAGLLGGYAAEDPDGFATVVAHEVAHLWWGAAVGSNSNDHTFINEGLATLSSLLYQEEAAGAGAAAEQREAWVTGPARALLARGDATVDLPIREGQDGTVRAWAYYAKAALGFLTLRDEIGEAAFRAGLRAFAEEYRFGIAEPGELRGAFEAASGRDLVEFWRHWFAAAEMTAEEIEAIAAG